jgi:NAD(P)-dependent dehydrogenase (short-subunit alcohol dehydrogenase family)
MVSLRRIGHLVRKEFIQIVRNKQNFGMLILAPLLQLVVLGYASRLDVKDVTVVVADMDVENGQETVRLIKEAGGNSAFVKCDVSREAEVEALVAQTVQLYGSLDFAFNNAGIGPDGVRIPICPIVDSPADAWLRHQDINLTGVFF